MGIDRATLHLLKEALAPLGDLAQRRILTLGVQDCYFTYDEALVFVRKHGIPHRDLQPDEIEPTRGFGWVDAAERWRYAGFIHQDTLFRLLGFPADGIESLDVNQFEGATIAHDLNQPVPDALRDSFDAVLDAGTLEHVFALTIGLANVAALCKVGGVAVHVSPGDYVNHGFYNVNATLFRDFYGSNGFRERALSYVATPLSPRQARRHYLRYAPGAVNAPLRPFYALSVFAAYEKAESVEPHVPQQGYYDRVWAAHEHQGIAATKGALIASLRRRVKNVPAAFLLHTLLTIRRGQRVLL